MSKVYFVIKKLPLCNNMSIKVILNYCVADSFAVVKHQRQPKELKNYKYERQTGLFNRV